ncbi:UNVERIFIED_ORG: hypothetical protein QE448_003421 [Rhizobium sp. SORGH_AS285]|nr:hypothetical protein [Rhizobium sp. SORGH_AS_0285]
MHSLASATIRFYRAGRHFGYGRYAKDIGFEIAACFFSPPGRRWPEGWDERASSPDISNLAPSSRCRDLLPGGEKEQAASARFKMRACSSIPAGAS